MRHRALHHRLIGAAAANVIKLLDVITFSLGADAFYIAHCHVLRSLLPGLLLPQLTIAHIMCTQTIPNVLHIFSECAAPSIGGSAPMPLYQLVVGSESTTCQNS